MSNQEARKEAIKAAYKEYFEKVKHLIDENGFLPLETWHKFIGYNGIKEIDMPRWCQIRPASLQGLETNNGWVRFEDENDLPKEEGQYLFLTKEKKESWNHYNPRIVGDGCRYKQMFIDIYTHYRPEKHPLPVY